MSHPAGSEGMLAALHRASVLGVQIVDAADVYAWGLTREFAAVRAACRAHMVAAAVGRRPPARAVPDIHLRKVVGDDC